MHINKVEYSSKNKKLAKIKNKDHYFVSNEIELYYQNKGDILEVVLRAKEDIRPMYIRLIMDKDKSFSGEMLANGFQSWSETKTKHAGDKIKKLNFFSNKNKLEKYGDYYFYKSNKKNLIHSHEMTYIKNDDNKLFIGSCNQDFAYTIFEKNFGRNEFSIFIDLEGLEFKREEEKVIARIYNKEGEDLEGLMDDYFSNIEGPREAGEACIAWSSWENFHKNVTEEIIKKTLHNIKENHLEFDYLVIDDGYENEIGDWLDITRKFSRGMKAIANEIKENGCQPGIWINPFCCSENSRLYREHREWIVKDSGGQELISGVNDTTNERYYVVDFYNEEFKNYLKKTFDTIINQWGFSLIKLSNLYAVSIIPRENKTRAMILSEALLFIDKVAKGAKLIGTGVPLGPAMKKMEYCRVGCNINEKWSNTMDEFVGFRERASVTSAIHNMIFRYFMTGRCFSNASVTNILRQDKLTDIQKHTILLLNYILGDINFFADDLALYRPEEIKLLKSLFPIFKAEDVKIDMIEQDYYTFNFLVKNKKFIAVSNMTGDNKIVKLPEGTYFERTLGIVEYKEKISIKPSQTLCFSKLEENEEQVWMITDGYIFPSIEYAGYEYDDGDVVIKFIDGFHNACNAYVVAFEDIGVRSINLSHTDKYEKGPYHIWKAKLDE